MSESAITDRLVSVQTLAEFLGVCIRTVRRMVERGQLPRPLRLGGVVRFSWAEVQETLKRIPRE